MKKNKVLFKRLGTILLTFSFLFGIFAQPSMTQTAKADNTQQPETLFLSDLDWESASIGWGENPNKDASVDGNTLTLSDNNGDPVTFEKGVGTHADSEIVYDISNLNKNFLTTWVGVDSEVGDSVASLQFQIYADGELKYESKVMNYDTPMEYATIDISNAETLKLVLNDGGDGNASDHGDWADIQLHTKDPIVRDTKEIKQYEGMNLIFNDEFDDSELNEDNWGTRSWPENGSHHYANSIGKDENIWVEDGNLIIQAKPYDGEEDFSTTTGHVVSDGKFDFRYGRIDVRAKIPTETGMWPAIWMMPADQEYGWPMEGEIDIMELISQEPNKIYSTIHSGLPNTEYFKSGGTTTIDQGTYYDDYHVYSMDWEPGLMKFFEDGRLIHEVNDWENKVINEEGEIVERDFPAPFDQEYYLKLNLATGGGWAIDVDDTTRYGDRTSMKIDYVRVYQEQTPNYNYSADAPFANEKQGAVWYSQKDNNGTWENYQQFDADSNTWISSETGVIGEGNDSAYVSHDSISANFAPESNYDASTIAFRAPYKGYAKVSLKDEVELMTDSEVTFNITKGDITSTQSDVLRTETITNDTTDLSTTKTYVPIEADEMIRFEIIESDNEVNHFNPVVEYITEAEYNSYVSDTTQVKRGIYNLPRASELTLEDKEAVEEVRAIYDDLSEEAKTLVTTISQLDAREAKLKQLEETDFDEIKSPQQIKSLIYNLTNARKVTLADKDEIEAARAEYEKLSEDDKALVTTISQLETREAKLDGLEK